MSELNEAINKLFGAPLPMKTDANAPVVGAMRRSAFTPEIRSIDEAKRTIDFVSSTESVDRYGDSIKVSGWKTDTYMRNPVVLWSHRHDQPPIGKTLSLSIESAPKPALIQRVQFADKATYEFADQVFRLYQGGFLRSVSVGFLPLSQPTPILDADGRSTGGYEFTSQELLELSAVPIPANPDCVSRAIDAGIITTADATKVFAPKSDEPASAGDLIGLAFNLGKLSHSIEFYQRVMRDTRQSEIRTPEDLERLVGHESITSVNELERLFRLE
jgi:Caudovirus prohead serine protease